MLAQPAIVLYDRIAMEAAAMEACRMLATMEAGGEEDVRFCIERRLSAVPSSEVFHAGAWNIEIEGGEASPTAFVRIKHSLRPLPIIGAGLGFLGMTDADGLYGQLVEKSVDVREPWLVESEFGIDPGAWIGRWDAKV